MKLSRNAAAVGLVLITALSTSAAWAQGDPGEITRHTIAAMNRVAHQCCTALEELSHRAANAINTLQDQGLDDQAAMVARRAAEAVNHRARRCDEEVHRIAARGIHALREIHAGQEFIDAVKEGLRQASQQIKRCRTAALQTIEEALND